MNLDQLTTNLECAIYEFRRKYSGYIERTIDISHLFLDENIKSFGPIDGEQRVVRGYMFSNGPLIQKYKLHKDGRPIFNGQHHEIIDIRNEHIVMALLCSMGMHNISLYEVYHPKVKNKRIQGFRQKTINSIIEAVQDQYLGFSPDKNSFFMFAGESVCVNNQVLLSKIILQGVVLNGQNAIYDINEQEAELMEKVIGKTLIRNLVNNLSLESVKPLAYFTNQVGSIPETAAFIYHKLKAYKKFI